jgi:hypothetical protein
LRNVVHRRSPTDNDNDPDYSVLCGSLFARQTCGKGAWLTRIRELFAKSKTMQANCHTLAADGRPCITAIQELYMKLRAPPDTS